MRMRLLAALLFLPIALPFRLYSSEVAVGAPIATRPVAPTTSPPRFPGPLPAIVTVDREDRLTVWMLLVSVHPVEGSKEGEQKMVQSLYGYDYRFQDIRAFDMKGKPVSAENLSRLLKRESRVVIAQAGSPIDAQHLRWFKEDVILLVVPQKPLAEWSATPDGKRLSRDAE